MNFLGNSFLAIEKNPSCPQINCLRISDSEMRGSSSDDESGEESCNDHNYDSDDERQAQRSQSELVITSLQFFLMSLWCFRKSNFDMLWLDLYVWKFCAYFDCGQNNQLSWYDLLTLVLSTALNKTCHICYFCCYL